jgi:hypothetical protein
VAKAPAVVAPAAPVLGSEPGCETGVGFLSSSGLAGLTSAEAAAAAELEHDELPFEEAHEPAEALAEAFL